jgi:hypothetical protein
MRVVTMALVGALAGCGTAETDLDGVWELQHVDDGGAIMSVWGSGPDDVWAAGGQVDRGLVLHDDGSGWTAVDTGADSLLWWAYGFSATDVYAVGERGLILHYDGASWARVESGTDRTLYGVWGGSADDVWIVGGDPAVPGAAVVLRGSHRSFRVSSDLPAAMAPNAIFKAYGYGINDVILVGSGGSVLRWNGTAWRREETPTSQPLFSLWGRAPDDIYAVGGYGRGEVLHYDGASWSLASDPTSAGLSGVFTAPDHPTIAVGAFSYVLEIGTDGTAVEPPMPGLDPLAGLHGVWGDGAGTTYAVGGDLFAYPQSMTGVILRRR